MFDKTLVIAVVNQFAWEFFPISDKKMWFVSSNIFSIFIPLCC